VAVVLSAGVLVAVSRSQERGSDGTVGTGGRRSTSRDEVADRPWPARVPAPGPWSATLAGSGDRFTFTTDGVVIDGLGRTTLELDGRDPRKPAPSDASAGQIVVLPDGARWYPIGPFRLEGQGDVAFTGRPGDQPLSLDATAFSSARARGPDVTVQTPSLEALIVAARSPVAAVGPFVSADGREVGRLPLPAGSRVSFDCPPPGPAEPPLNCPPPWPPFPLKVSITAAEGMTVTAAGNGEAAVAGQARAQALDRTWDGLVGAVEATDITATAVYGNGAWTLTAQAAGARQVWIDVWPVVETVLSARSVGVRPGFFDTKDLRIEWTNVGYATSQIFEAEGLGDGAPTVGFDLNETLGHDAGLGVGRGDRVINLRGGGDIDSNLAPGEGVNRRLSALEGTEATIVLRGNFPDVHVPLAIPPARR
jgi:hypothetical protein